MTLEVPFGESYSVSESGGANYVVVSGTGEGFEHIDGIILPGFIYDLNEDSVCQPIDGQLAKYCTHTVTNKYDVPANTPVPPTNTPEPTSTLVPGPEVCESDLIAKFEFQGGGYVQSEGLPGIVSVSGNASGGTWTSTTPISQVIIKGATGTFAYGGGTSGSFSNTDLPLNNGGQVPDISNIQFCGTKPTNTPEPTATDKPADPTNTPEPTATDKPADPTNTPEPTATDKPADPTSTPEPTATDEPVDPTNTPEPTATNEPNEPTETPVPTDEVTPEVTPDFEPLP
jgi:hypothetical protein